MNTPRHAFFCKTYYQILQAILFVFDKKEPTAIFLCTDYSINDDDCDFQDTDLIAFHHIQERDACAPVTFIIANDKRTDADVLACRYLYNEDVDIHVFPPASRFFFFNRDDIICHEDGDSSYWRRNGELPETQTYTTHRLILRKSPDGYDRKKDRKVRVWDFLDILRNLPAEDKTTLLHIFKVAPVKPAEKSVLFVRKSLRDLHLDLYDTGAIMDTVRELMDDLRGEGWDVWCKEHPWIRSTPEDTGCPEDHIIRGYIPAELLCQVIQSPFKAVVGLRSAAVESMEPNTTRDRYNGLTEGAMRTIETKAQPEMLRTVLLGIKKIALHLLETQSNRTKWTMSVQPNQLQRRTH